ncbi:AAEL000507-PA [Aedes aegypti]|uniref:AAEL000507-PA n=2 Tax=Aedes aegypti TaxID=7159 RepID=Q17P51_AEDAE|nr:AAEL000507-PA [Aedes aegypti]
MEANIKFDLISSFEHNQCYLIGENEFDFNMFFTKGLTYDQEIGVKNTMTTDILLEYLASTQGKCSVRNLLEGRCPNVNQSLSLEECHRTTPSECDPNYPYRSYDGRCNNLQHASWGQNGNAFKSEIATCYDDYVSKRRLSSSGRDLPNNRAVISDLKRVFEYFGGESGSWFSLLGLVFCESINTDMIGRAMKRVRNATTGFRGCRADGCGVSYYRAPLACPMSVSPDDPNYGPLNVECLNFNPIEQANDQCSIRYPSKRNIESSYLDLSHVYEHGNYDSEGKIISSFCHASSTFESNKVLSIQFLAVTGLFTQLHNYCVDKVKLCGNLQNREEIIEKCRSLTIGVYQRIIYEEVLPTLLGDSYSQCNFDCEYDENLESTISLSYVGGPGRFQHIWIPDNVTIVQGEDRVQKPFFEFFRNYESHDCSGVLKGLLEDPIHTGTLSETLINTFFSKDGALGHCLLCLDLERGRDSGLCPMILYKHYFDKIAGRETKCYNSFDDLADTFDLEVIEVFKKHYESPYDIDLLFLLFEYTQDDPTNLLPQTIGTATCLQFKLLKCSDRFFYSWNEFLTPALQELINSINMSTLLAMFGDMEEVPVDPWNIYSERVPAKKLQNKLNHKSDLFCSV